MNYYQELKSKKGIEWCEQTINPVAGCKKISTGCQRCYAELMHKRLMTNPITKDKYCLPFNMPTFHEESLLKLGKMKKGKRVFIGSMSDLFQQDVTAKNIELVLRYCRGHSQHTYMFLTKRPERMVNFLFSIPIGSYVGVTVEHSDYFHRLKFVNRIIRSGVGITGKIFISFEPLLNDFMEGISHSERALRTLSQVDWIIVGGETGPNARPIKKEWVTPIRDFAEKHSIPFFFKQWNKKGDRLLDGKEYNQVPIRYDIFNKRGEGKRK